MNRFVFGEHADMMHSFDNDCKDARPSVLPDDMVVAMAYVPMQFFDTMFEVEEGFSCGSIFPELIKPFTGCDPR